MDVDFVASKIEAATRPEDVFGDLPGDAEVKLRALRRAFRKIVRMVHPDRTDHPRAKALTQRLDEWRDHAEARIHDGVYGSRRSSAPRGRMRAGPAVIRSRGAVYAVTETLAGGDIADLYLAETRTGDKTKRVAVKMAREARDRDLMERESRVLKRLFASSDAGVEHFRRYLPEIYASFSVRESGKVRQTNVFKDYGEGRRYFSFARVMEAYPRGLRVPEAAWMVNRMLEVLAWTHRQGIVHGAVLPAHVLVSENHHGAKLIDWCYAVEDWQSGKRVEAISPAYRDWYPPEVLAKLPATPATDIYMAAGCAIGLLGGNGATGAIPATVPRRLARILEAARIPNPHRRYTDAFDIYTDFKEALETLYGKPFFTPFKMPR